MLNKINWTLLTLCAIAAAGYALLYGALPKPAAAPAAAPPLDWPTPPKATAEEWSVVKGSQAAPTTVAGPLAKRFRLAGTFFAFGEAGSGSDYCKAILDDLDKKQQVLVREGDSIDDVQVVRIQRDRLVLRSQGREEELLLSFANLLLAGSADAVKPLEAPTFAGETVLEVNRFGKRVGENRWVLSRDALMKYYEELLEDPERLASLYVSMKPDYKDKAIAGYNIDIEGEKDFFAASGLQNGDVMRKVNSMNMVSQARAEYFIGEFVKNRVNALVLDIERDGQPKKMIYLIR